MAFQPLPDPIVTPVIYVDKRIDELDFARPEASLNELLTVVYDTTTRKTVKRALGAALTNLTSNNTRGGTKYVRYLSSLFFGVPATATTLDKVSQQFVVVNNPAVVLNPSPSPTQYAIKSKRYVAGIVEVGTPEAFRAFVDANPETTATTWVKWFEQGTPEAAAAALDFFNAHGEIIPESDPVRRSNEYNAGSTVKYLLNGSLLIFAAKRYLDATAFANEEIPAPTGLQNDPNWTAAPINNFEHEQNTDAGTRRNSFTIQLDSSEQGHGAQRTLLLFGKGWGANPAALAYRWQNADDTDAGVLELCADFDAARYPTPPVGQPPLVWVPIGGAGSTAFNWNRPITRAIPGLQGLTIGGSSVAEGLEKLFFVAVAPGAGITASAPVRERGADTLVALNWYAAKNSNAITRIEVAGVQRYPVGIAPAVPGAPADTFVEELDGSGNPTGSYHGTAYARTGADTLTDFVLTVQTASESNSASARVQYEPARYLSLGAVDLIAELDAIAAGPANLAAAAYANLSAEVRALAGSKELTSGRAYSSRTVAPAQEYIYTVWEAPAGAGLFTLNGLPNTDFRSRVFPFTTSAGVVVSYRLSRSGDLLDAVYTFAVN